MNNLPPSSASNSSPEKGQIFSDSRALLKWLIGSALLNFPQGAWFRLPFPVLIILSGMAGLVIGAAQGYLRVILNNLVDAGGLPRAPGLAASLNEVIFVLAPVVASALGTLSPTG